MMSRLMINRTRTSHLLILSLLSSFFPPPLLCGWKHVIIFTPSPPWRTNIDICLFHLGKNSGLFIENRGWKKEKKAGLFFPPSSSCSDHSHVPLEWFCWWRSSLEEPAQTDWRKDREDEGSLSPDSVQHRWLFPFPLYSEPAVWKDRKCQWNSGK